MSASKYDKVHEWLIKKFGKATLCKKCGLPDKKRYEYALIKGKEHEFNRSHYSRMCTSCHRQYDWTEEKSKQISERMKGEGNVMYGKKFTQEHLINMSKGLKGKIPWNKKTII